MTNREFIRMQLEVPGNERDFQFVFEGGWLRGYSEYAHDTGDVDTIERPDWNEWLDQEVDQDVMDRWRGLAREED